MNTAVSSYLRGIGEGVIEDEGSLVSQFAISWRGTYAVVGDFSPGAADPVWRQFLVRRIRDLENIDLPKEGEPLARRQLDTLLDLLRSEEMLPKGSAWCSLPKSTIAKWPPINKNGRRRRERFLIGCRSASVWSSRERPKTFDWTVLRIYWSWRCPKTPSRNRRCLLISA